MKTTSKLTFTLITIIILLSSIIIYQQTQIQELKTNIQTNQYLKQYLLSNYGVSSIEELIQKKLKEYGLHYTGNPFTTAVYPGQFQAENITGMHWYTYLGGSLQNRTDVLAYPSLPASYIIEGRDDDGDGVLDVVWAKNGTTGQILRGVTLTVNHNDNAVFDLTGSASIKFANLWIEVPSEYSPNTVFLLARDNSKISAGYHEFENVEVRCMNNDTIGFYVYGSEIITWKGCYISTRNYGVFLTSNNKLDFTSDFKTIASGALSTSVFRFYGCDFVGYNGGLNERIALEGITGAYFYGCYSSGTKYAIKLFPETDDVKEVVIIGWRTESPLITIDAQTSIRRPYYFKLIGVSAFVPDLTKLIDLNKANVFARGWFIDGIRGVPGAPDVSIEFYGLLYSHIRLGGLGGVGESNNEPNLVIGDGGIYGSIVDMEDSADFSCSGSIEQSRISFRLSGGGTSNSGTAFDLADGSFIVHGLVGTPTTVVLTCLNSTYDGVPVIVSWDEANTNSTHIAVDIYWANGTAITDPVIAVSWHAEYQP